MVLKPSPDTPWAATIMGRLVAERTDIPPGVINVVPSSRADAGEALVADERVDMISFTGSTATGRAIMRGCADTVKKCFLELGGKSANVMLDDADFGAGIGLGTAYVCTHAGQGCALYTRLLLPRSRYDEGVEMAKMAFESFGYGDPSNPAFLQGPQINERQRDKVLGLIEQGVSEGGRVIAGGRRPSHLEKGYYMEPTILVDVDPGATLAQEEIFGPVLVIIPYEDDDDAVRIANDSKYGLSGSVWSASTDRAMDVARRIRTGTVSINGGQWLHVTRPFGGYKQSGVGRENGLEGFEEYLQTKVVALPA
jgi:aldehyde dehydrogenase (NAD+)